MNEQSEPPLPQAFLNKLNAVKNKRARIVIEHILKHGSISTEELKALYGYNHPPRAAKDVRDEGIPLITFTIKGSDGRSIAAYKFGTPSAFIDGRGGGRIAFSKKFKRQLYETSEHSCGICQGKFQLRELQIDHRIPYEIVGEVENPEQHPEAFMLVCGSCNRAKSWSCEHCPNWTNKAVEACTTCYWASPLNHNHVALKKIRRTDILWEGDEVEIHTKAQKSSEQQSMSLQDYIKSLLKNILFLILLPTIALLFFVFVLV